MIENIRVLKRAKVHQLSLGIQKNITRYIDGSFDDLLLEEDFIVINDLDINKTALHMLSVDKGGLNDCHNSLLVRNSLKDLSRYHARDERLWVGLCHTHFLKYCRERWLKRETSTDKLVELIKNHFFVNGARGFERSNAVASLWWWSEIASSYDRLDLKTTLEILLHKTDVRASILERPTISQSILPSIMDILVEKYNSKEKNNFFDRNIEAPAQYRTWLRQVNRYGGTTFFESMTREEITEALRSYLPK